jgi:hypothetical protein
MRFVLLVGCLSLSAWAAVITVRLRNLNRKFAGFPPIYGNAALLRGSSRGADQRRSQAARRSPPEVLEPTGNSWRNDYVPGVETVRASTTSAASTAASCFHSSASANQYFISG